MHFKTLSKLLLIWCRLANRFLFFFYLMDTMQCSSPAPRYGLFFIIHSLCIDMLDVSTNSSLHADAVFLHLELCGSWVLFTEMLMVLYVTCHILFIKQTTLQCSFHVSWGLFYYLFLLVFYYSCWWFILSKCKVHSYQFAYLI